MKIKELAETQTPPFPPDIWAKLYHNGFKYAAAGQLKHGVSIDELIKRYTNKRIGSQEPGIAPQCQELINALEELKKRRAND